MTEDFNIRDNLWDLLFPYYLIHRDMLTNITDSFQLGISISTVWVPMRYTDNQDNSNLVIDLMLLRPMSEEFDNHSIQVDWRLSSDHALLTVKISISEENIQFRKCTIIKNSEEDIKFVDDVKILIKGFNILHINSIDNIEKTVQEFTDKTNDIWFKHSKLVNITKCSKLWWNEKCPIALEAYRSSRHLENWKSFKRAVKSSKWEFFNSKIQEILSKRKDSWELMN